MALNLTPEDNAEYRRRVGLMEHAKQIAIAQGNHRAARAARQSITKLYHEYERKQVRPEPVPSRRQREYTVLSLEQRVERLEQLVATLRIQLGL